MLKPLTLCTIAAGALVISACTNQPSSYSGTAAAPGVYKRTYVSTDRTGTVTEKTVTKKVKVNRHGHKKVVVKTKVTKDPPGMLNKHTVAKSKEVINEDGGKTNY